MSGYHTHITMNLSQRDFPTLSQSNQGEVPKPSPKPLPDPTYPVLTKTCLLCQKKVGREHFSGDALFYSRFLPNECLCKNCIKASPQQYILHKYLEKDEQISDRQKQFVCEWITIFPDKWPHQWDEKYLAMDQTIDVKWESFKYFVIWLREKRKVNEHVAWYSSRQRIIVKGVIKIINDDGTYVVERKAETEKEKELGEKFRKTMTRKRLLPPLSQRDSVYRILNTPGIVRPNGCRRCCGPCGRERIGQGGRVRMKNNIWYCDECYETCKIREKDENLRYATGWLSDREHVGFGGCIVPTGRKDTDGRDIMKHITCSCSMCHYHNREGYKTRGGHPSRNHTCHSCGVFNNDGWFDRTNKRKDAWMCRRCWGERYWVTDEDFIPHKKRIQDMLKLPFEEKVWPGYINH